MERKIEEIPTMELKAIAYDTLTQLQMWQQNLNAINVELGKRSQLPREVSEESPISGE